MDVSEYLELEKRAKKLSKEIAYVSEMNRFCSSLVHTTTKILALMDENTTKDNTFGELVAQVNGAATAKVQTADVWLIEARAKIDRYTARLAEESISDA